MNKECDFCKNILNQNDFDKECNGLEDCCGTHYFIVCHRDGDYYLETYTVVDDYFYNGSAEMQIDFCPVCGRNLNHGLQK